MVIAEVNEDMRNEFKEIKGQFPGITFGDLCAIALKRNETCFGVRLKAEEENEGTRYGIYLNPEKSRTFPLTADDIL